MTSGKSAKQSRALLLLRKMNLGGLQLHQRVPTALPKGAETSNLAFCPLLLKYADKGLCGKVDCRNCEFPYLEYGDVSFQWLCSSCGTGLRALPYFGDGECEGCGLDFCILTMSATQSDG